MTDRAAYSVAQLAERWGCSDGHLYGMIRSGELHAFKLGTLLRVRVEEVERIERGSSVNPRSVPDTPANTAKTARIGPVILPAPREALQSVVVPRWKWA